VIGRKITRLLRDEITLVQGRPFPGISTGERRVYNVFMELDGKDLLKVGRNRHTFPLEIVAGLPSAFAGLRDFEVDEAAHSCLGEEIVDVLVSSINEVVVLRLSGGRFFWQEHDIWGTELYLEPASNLARKRGTALDDMLPYWD